MSYLKKLLDGVGVDAITQPVSSVVRSTATAKRVLMPSIHSSNICSYLSFPTAPIAAILPTPPSAIKTILISV